jgi:zinc protease
MQNDALRAASVIGAALTIGAAPQATHAAVAPGDLPKGISFVTSVEGIDEYRLANGLEVLLFPDPSKETATVNITYFVGSRHEDYGETGMAHLLEHLLFKGSTNHRDIPQELTAHGCRPNGTTWFDRTNYFETFAASDENLDWALDLEADRMVNSFIAKKDLDSEMSVVRNEFEIGENDPQSILQERIYSTAFLWHNYGKSTIGARSDIEGVPIERLQAFYKKWYRPDNTMLVVSGRFDPVRTLRVIHEKFSPIPNPTTPIQRTYTSEPAQDGERTVTLRRVGDTQVAAAGYHIPAGTHADHPALQLLAFILGDAPSGRLHKKLVETERATRVSASADRFHDPGLFYVEVELRKDLSLDDARDELLATTEHMAETPPSADEVERAKANYLRNFEQSMRNSSRSAIGLSEWAAMGDWRLLFYYRDLIRGVTPDDIGRVAGTYLVSNNRTLGVYVPTSEPERVEIPSAAPTETLLAAYTGGTAMTQGESFDPTPENIESRVQRIKLPVGLEVVLLPKKTRGATVNLCLRLNLGNAEALQGLRPTGELTADMLRRGTHSRSRQQIKDEVERHRSTLNVFGGPTEVTGVVETTSAFLPQMIDLLADVVRNPSFPAEEFRQAQQEAIQDQEEAKTDPRSRASTTINRHLNPWPPEDVRYTPTPEEAIAGIEAVQKRDLEAFHERFYGASSAQLAVVGDFDAVEVQKLAEELFGDWPSKTPYEFAPNTYSDRPPLVSTIETPDKESASFSANFRLPMQDSDPDYPALTLGSYITGGGFLNSRLATRIRRTDGLSYGVGAAFGANERVPSAWFASWAIYAPQNDERLVNAFREEIQRVLDSGFAEKEGAEAKSGWLQSRQVSRSQDGELASRLARYAELGRTLTWDAELENKVRALTPSTMHQAFQRHIDLKRFSIVRAGDFTGSKKEVVAN